MKTKHTCRCAAAAATTDRTGARRGALLVPVLLALQACSTVPGEPPVVVECKAPAAGVRGGPALVGQDYGMAMSPIPLNSVQFGSHESARSMAVQSLHAARTATDSVSIHVRFVSCADQPTAVRMRTSFLRGDMSPAEAPTPWKLVMLQPRALAVYSELSTTRDVAAYVIEVTQ